LESEGWKDFPTSSFFFGGHSKVLGGKNTTNRKQFMWKLVIFVEVKIEEMNIQARKLNLIEEFLRLSDESVIEKLESLIKFEKKNNMTGS